jgi:hypothetical protein
LIAVGCSNGKTILTRTQSFTGSFSIKQDEFIAEYVPKHARACNVVDFCPSQNQWLLSGLDKVRNDHCVLVWDLNGPRFEFIYSL